jgi:hypothetical protein
MATLVGAPDAGVWLGPLGEFPPHPAGPSRRITTKAFLHIIHLAQQLAERFRVVCRDDRLAVSLYCDNETKEGSFRAVRGNEAARVVSQSDHPAFCPEYRRRSTALS